jgi:hypothetical protein
MKNKLKYFIPEGIVTVQMKDNWLDGKIGTIVKVATDEELKKAIKDKVCGTDDGPIIVNFPQEQARHLNRWIYLKPEELILGRKKPLTIEEIVNEELGNQKNPPHSVSVVPERIDQKCCVVDCDNYQEHNIWFNIMGSGIRIPACTGHYIKHGILTWADQVNFEIKECEVPVSS